MIPTGELVAMQESINSLLPDTCQILTLTHTSDGAGGYTDTVGTSTAIACRLDFTSRSEQLTAGAVQPFSRGILTMPHDASIVSTNQILHGGITYNVIGSPNYDASWLGCIRVTIEAVR